MLGGTVGRVVAGLVIGAAAAAAPAAAGAVDIQVAPRGVRIGAFFAGADIELAGTAEASLDVVVEVFGPEEADLFNLKGRVGPLWLNVQEVELEHAPHVYLLLTSDELATTEALGELELGLEQVERGIVVRPSSLDREMIFEQFLRLKGSQGLYDELQGAIAFQPQSGGRRAFQAEFRLPSSTVPGVYRVVATAIGDSGVVDRYVTDLWVAEAGPIKMIHDLAVNHGLVYGIASVIIALVVGGMIGVVFRRVGTH